MLRALFERDVRPDLVLGTSVGALNGLVVATDPTPAVVDRLLRPVAARSGRATRSTATAPGARCSGPSARAPTSTPPTPLRERLEQEFGDLTFDQLAVQFQCCAASIERAAEHWFTEGPVVPAVVASAAVPGPAARRRGSATSTTSTAAS